MGRKTWQSLPPPAAATGRTSSSRATRRYAAEGADVAASLDEALAACDAAGAGVLHRRRASSTREALPLATRLHLTEIDRDFDGDARFPAFDRDDWRVESRAERHQRRTADALRHFRVDATRHAHAGSNDDVGRISTCTARTSTSSSTRRSTGDDFAGRIAVMTAILATLGALFGYQGGATQNDALLFKNEAAIKKTEASDQWNFYQAKSNKQNLAELGATLTSGDVAERYKSEAKRYSEEKKDIQKKAEELEKAGEGTPTCKPSSRCTSTIAGRSR